MSYAISGSRLRCFRSRQSGARHLTEPCTCREIAVARCARIFFDGPQVNLGVSRLLLIPMSNPSLPLSEFLEAMLTARCWGVRTAGAVADYPDQVELYYEDSKSGTERAFLLRAALRDGDAVLILGPDARLSQALHPRAG